MSTGIETCVSEELQIVEYVLISGPFSSVGRKNKVLLHEGKHGPSIGSTGNV
jgi:hypothetical protein